MHRALASYAQPSEDEAEVLRRHGPLIDRLARRIVLRTGMRSAYDDLWSAGALGLLEAVKKFDGTRGASFETFAEHRVRGAMLDELRRMDHLPRRLRSRTDDLVKARRRLGAKLGREPTIEEVASEMEVELEEASEMEALLEPHLPLESALPYLTDRQDPEDPVIRAEARRALVSAIESLPERLQMVLALLYTEGLTYREVGRLLQVSEPRVCQLHADAIARLRASLGVTGQV